MPDSEAKRAWDAKNTTCISLKLNNNTDADILRHLDQQDSKQGYIKELIRREIEARFEEIDALEPEEATEKDLLAFNDNSDAITLEDFKAAHEYSGQIRLRIPKALHKALAMEAKENGVSLNQYMVYKLSKA